MPRLEQFSLIGRFLAGAAVVGLAGWMLATAVAGAAAVRPTVVDVVAGKPYEFDFALSRFSALPAGPITFVVKNRGASGHNFVLCEAPVKTDARNSCTGYQSMDLQPGESTKITIADIRPGKYEFLSSDPGDAAAGMKGLIGIGVVVQPPHSSPPPKPAPSPVAPAPVAPATTTSPTDTTTTTASATTTTGTHICKENGLIQGVSTSQLC